MRIVLVEPIYDMNVGKICRIMSNFGFDELFIVNPIAKLGFTARKYAKHAAHILNHARIMSSFDECIAGRYPVIGTTSSLAKGKRLLNKTFELSELCDAVNVTDNAAIVFGREDNGLPAHMLSKCDACTYIQTSDSYPSMNLSNAVAVVLYALRNPKLMRTREEIHVDAYTMHALQSYFNTIVDNIPSGNLKNPSKCKKSFKNLLSRSHLSLDEARSMICVFKEIVKMEKKSSPSFDNLHSRGRK